MSDPGRGDRGGRVTAAIVAVVALVAVGGATALGLGLAGQVSAPPVPAGTSGVPSAVAAPSEPAAGLPPSPPAELRIPAIGVGHALATLGTAADGTMEGPPLDAVEVPGWYRRSPAPGSPGPSIVLGHVDSAREGPGVFFRLGELRPGDPVEVTRRDGTVVTFTVDGVGRYPKTDFPTLRVYRDIDHAGLRLITCGGEFDEAAGDYRDNVVVFAHLTGVRPPG